MTHLVTDIQRFCMHDGPGLRTTVFLKGCPLHCFWCHNPETNSEKPQLMYHESKCIGCMTCLACPQGVHFDAGGRQGIDYAKCISCGQCAESCPTGALSIAGKAMETEEILSLALRDKPFYGKEGGITLSGGEPMNDPEGCISLLRSAKERGLHTAVETCGYFDAKYVAPLCQVTDCLLWDIKDTDEERHRKNTGVSGRRILENLRLADSCGVPIILRCVMLRGINLNEAHIANVKEIFASLRNGLRIDFLPCHSLGNAKAEAIGRKPVPLSQFEPTAEECRMLREAGETKNAGRRVRLSREN